MLKNPTKQKIPSVYKRSKDKKKKTKKFKLRKTPDVLVFAEVELIFFTCMGSHCAEHSVDVTEVF